MPESVPGAIVRELLQFAPIELFLPDSAPIDVYLDPVPADFLRLTLPPAVRAAAAMRNAVGRTIFIAAGSADSLVPRIARHLEGQGWVWRDTKARNTRPLAPGEGLYCRRNAALIVGDDTTGRRYVTVSRLAPLLSFCATTDTTERGTPKPLIDDVQAPQGWTRSSSGWSGSGVEQQWHAKVDTGRTVREIDEHYARALASQRVTLGAPVARGDTLVRSARLVDRGGTSWTGEMRVFTVAGERIVVVRVKRELEPDEK